MLMTMVTKPASHASIDRAPAAAARPLAGPWHRSSTALMHSIGIGSEPIVHAERTCAEERGCVRSSLSQPSNRAVPAQSVFQQALMNFAMADAAREVSPVPQVASVEPSNVSSNPGEFYSEFYRGGFFVVARESQVAVFKGGKWWAV